MGKIKRREVIGALIIFLVGIFLGVFVHSYFRKVPVMTKKKEVLTTSTAIKKVEKIPASPETVKLSKEGDDRLEEYSKRMNFIAEQFLELSEKNMSTMVKIRETIGWNITLIATVMTLILLGLGYTGWKGYGKMMKECEKMREDLKKSTEKAEKEVNELTKRTEKVFCELMARSYLTLGLVAYCMPKKNVKKAIELTEKALEHQEKAISTVSPSEEEKKLLCQIKSNLAYYYAEAKMDTKRVDAINYARISLAMGKEQSNMDWIDNFVFVMVYFAETEDEKKELKKVFENYEESLRKHLDNLGLESVFQFYVKEIEKNSSS